MVAVLETIPSKEQLYELYAKAYDPTTRVELVTNVLQTALQSVGADQYLTQEQLSALANCTTAAGLAEKAQEVGPVYCPKLYEKGTGLYDTAVEKYEKYAPAVLEAKDVVASKVALARDPDGRRELLVEGKELAENRIVSPAKEKAAPYIQKLADKKAAIVMRKDAFDKRLVRAMDALKEARSHPAETASALKATALDLIKYDKLTEYREYVLSDAFAADTRRLVQEDLPRLAHEAAGKGKASIQAKASALSAEIERSAMSIKHALANPRDLFSDIPALQRLLILTMKARCLLADLTLKYAEYLPDGAKQRLEWLAAYIKPAAESSDAIPDIPKVLEASKAKAVDAEKDCLLSHNRLDMSLPDVQFQTSQECAEASRAFEDALEAACKEVNAEDVEDVN